MSISHWGRLVLALGCGLVVVVAAPAQDNAGPRLGQYKVYLRDVQFSILELLPNGKYKAYDTTKALLGEGDYEYDAKEKRVRWLSGRYKTNGYGGTFFTRKDGKQHVIRLTGISEAVSDK